MKKYRLYYREHRCWLEVDKETYLQIRRERQRIYYKRKNANECYCNKQNIWRCDGMCDTCEFYKETSISLSETLSESEDLTMMGCISDNGEQERMCLQALESQEILDYIKEIMPELLEYGKMRLMGMKDAEIAKQWGISRMAIYKKILKVKKQVEEKFGKI